MIMRYRKTKSIQTSVDGSCSQLSFIQCVFMSFITEKCHVFHKSELILEISMQQMLQLTVNRNL